MMTDLSFTDRYNSSMTKIKSKLYTLRSIFMHVDGVDKLLMGLGLIGAVGDDFSQQMVMFVTSRLMDNFSLSDSAMILSLITLARMPWRCVTWHVASGLLVSLGYCWTRTAERQTSRMRARYLKAVLRQDVGYFDLHVTSTSEIISCVSTDSLVIQDAISEKVPMIVMNMSTFIGGYIMAFAMLWRLAIVGLPFLFLLIIPGLIYGRTVMKIAKEMRNEYNKAGTIAEQAISSIRTVYSFMGERKTISEYSLALQGTVNLGVRQGLAKGLAIGSNGVVFAIWSFMCYYGSRLVMHHGAHGGTVICTVTVIANGGLALGASLSNLKYFAEASAAGERIMEMIQRKPKIDSENMEGQVLQNISGEINFKHVEFAYPSRPETLIFKDFNLNFISNNTTALVGASGSGKSTVIALLQRFYDPVGGEILFDGIAIDKLQLKWLRSQMGLVSQEPALLATSIKENILFGKEDATIEDVIAAAKASNAHNFINQLPQGYDTQVGERGIQMSGGQKQRIAVARAIIKSPRILLLDEATSALDTESERIVQNALDQSSLGRTTIVIAHRLSTIRNADVIAVIQNGLVIEKGPRDKIIQIEKGVYASLIRLQQTNNDLIEELATNSSLSYDTNNTSRLSAFSQSNLTGSVTPSLLRVENNIIKEEKTIRGPSFWRLLAMNSPERKQANFGCVSASLFGAVQPTYALCLGMMVSVFFLPDHNEIKYKTKLYALLFVAIAIFSLLINIWQHYNFAYMGEYLTKRIREQTLSKILTFETGWFDRDENATGAICSRLNRDANVVRSLVCDRMTLLVQTFSSATIAFTIGMVIAWRLALVMIGVQPIFIACYYCKRVLLINMSKKSIKSQDESSKLAGEAVSNLLTITSFSSQARILKMLEKSQDCPRRENIRQSWYAGIGLGISQGLMTCTWALDFWYGAKLISQGHIGPKEFFETYIVLVSTGRVIADAGSMTNDLAKGSEAVASVFSFLDRYTKIDPEDHKGYKSEKIIGNVELHDVEFAYPARPDVMILKGFSIKIEAGKSTALVGQSGSGKSTIIGLIERFYDPLKGVVKIDGRDIRTYHLRSLRKHIAFVSQEPTLFSGIILDNITFGCDESDEMEIVETAKASNAMILLQG